MKFLSFCLAFSALMSSDRLNAQCAATINTFPYNESFESGTGFWVSGGTNNDWAWGTPSKSLINSAGAGNKCWITGGLVSSFYNYGERSWVESPCFDFSSLNRPMVSFLIYWETERIYDGGNFQYSIDGGNTWINVGSISSPNTCTDQNWFTVNSITNLNGLVNNKQGWSGTVRPTNGSCNGGGGSGGWVLASHCLKNLANQPQVQFRFTFGAGTTCNDYDGLAFDDITIQNAPDIPVDFTFSCTGGLGLSFADTDPGCHSTWTWNFGDSASASNQASGNTAAHQFSKGGTYYVTLSMGGNCANDTQIVKPVILLDASVHTIPVSCKNSADGRAQAAVANPVAGLNYAWSDNPLNNSFIDSNLSVGSYSVILSAPGTCDLTLPFTIAYGPGAEANVSLGNDTTICPGSIFRLYPGKYSSYLWQDNSSDSVFLVREPGIYYLSVTNRSGCSASDTLIATEDCMNDLVIPSSFTPNQDGINETFNVAGSETSSYKMLIFNRWGEVIFKSEDRNTGWDGTYKGNVVQEGIYNYLVNYEIGGKENVKSGAVFLFR